MGKIRKDSKRKNSETRSIKSSKSAEISPIHQPSIKNPDPNDHNMAVMHNFIARAVTRWSLEEAKFFICALSQIGTHDENGWVKLSKRDLNRVLEYKKRSSEWLRRITSNIAQNSWVHFETETGWDDGFLINRTRADRWNVYIRFEKDYLPLLEKLTSHFTTVYVESIAKLNHKSSYSLYLYLKSWADPKGRVSHRYIYKKDIHRVFNLTPGSYTKNPGTDKERFDWYSFEKYCLIPAVEDINKNEKGEIEIFEIKKLKSGKNSRYVNGYSFAFRTTDGFIKSLSHPKALEYREDGVTGNKIRINDPLPSFEEVEKVVSHLEVSAPEVFKRLAEQHKKHDISDWTAYIKQIARNIIENKKRKRGSRKEVELPDWYTYIPDDKPTPEVLLQTFLLESRIAQEDPMKNIEEYMQLTGLSRDLIEFYIQHPEKLKEKTKSLP